MTLSPVGARLVAVSGPLCGEVLPLPEEGATIGRDTSNDICFSDSALSRAHCSIDTADGAWRIRDAQGSNGTFVNGTQITDHLLADRDHIELGESIFVFMLNPYPSTFPALLEQPLEPIARLRVDDTVLLRTGAKPSASPRREAHQLRALLEISTTLNRFTTEEEVNRQLLDLVARSLPAEQVGVVAVGQDGDHRVVDARQVGQAAAMPVSQTVVRQALEQRTSMLTRSAGDDDALADPLRREPLPSIMCVPMVVRNRALGALYLTTTCRDAFDAEHLEFATAVANVAAVALDNVRHVAWFHRETARLQEDVERDHSLVGRSAAMRAVYELIGQGRDVGRDRADNGRDRHRQGTRRQGRAPQRRQRDAAVCRDQLRRAHRDAARNRALRPRARRVHRRGGAEKRQARGRRWRHRLSRRGRRARRRRSRPSSCAPSSCVSSSGSAARVRSGSTSASSPRPTAACGTTSPPAASGATSTIASTSSKSTWRRCANAGMTLPCSPAISWNASPRKSARPIRGISRRSAQVSDGVRLARQRARAREYDRARHRARQLRPHHARRSARRAAPAADRGR